MSTEKAAEALRRSVDFSHASDAIIEKLSATMRSLEVFDGEEIWSEGDDAAFCYLLGAGKVRLSVASVTGDPETIATVGRGELLGEMTALAGRDRTSSAVAVGDV